MTDIAPSTQLQQFMGLFAGRTDAYGTGRGQWIKREPTPAVYAQHLRGEGPGLGIAPLTDDGMVRFAAIDLDEPNFELAREMQTFLEFGSSFIERSRSGNAHVWVFFAEPIEAWVVRGILREATTAVGKPAVEVFPKQDKLLPGMVGNYINLPYHGAERPILLPNSDEPADLEVFISWARGHLNDPDAWRKRARWLMIAPPEDRIKDRQEFGTGKELHICAETIIANRDENPILEGARNVVYFHLAKQLLHYEGFDDDEAWMMLTMVRDSAEEQGVDHFSDYELRRLFDNARRGGYTSTGCDAPEMQPYVHPDCPIVKAAN